MALPVWSASTTTVLIIITVKIFRVDILAIVNASGSVVAKYDYDAWGNCTIVSDTSGANTLISQHIDFKEQVVFEVYSLKLAI